MQMCKRAQAHAGGPSWRWKASLAACKLPNHSTQYCSSARDKTTGQRTKPEQGHSTKGLGLEAQRPAPAAASRRLAIAQRPSSSLALCERGIVNVPAQSSFKLKLSWRCGLSLRHRPPKSAASTAGPPACRPPARLPACRLLPQQHPAPGPHPHRGQPGPASAGFGQECFNRINKVKPYPSSLCA